MKRADRLRIGLFPLVKGLYTVGDLGTKTLPQVLGIPYGILVFGVVLAAVGGFLGATWVEKKMAAKAAPAGE